MLQQQPSPTGKDRPERILDAVLTLLARHGISGVSMRAVAREAGVALGLVNYYYEDKSGLIQAALQRIEQDDVSLVDPDPSLPPEQQVRAALERGTDPELLSPEYLTLRLQLWALGSAQPEYAAINTSAHMRYRAELASLIAAARPQASQTECLERANDVTIIQNGIWLTTLLGFDRSSLSRARARCEAIALAP